MRCYVVAQNIILLHKTLLCQRQIKNNKSVKFRICFKPWRRCRSNPIFSVGNQTTKIQKYNEKKKQVQTNNNIIDKNSVLVKIHDNIDFSFVNDLCDEFYSENGQNGFLPELVFRVSFIQFFKNGLSDNEVDDEIFDDCKLSRFRKEIGADKFKQIFDFLVQKIISSSDNEARMMSKKENDVKPSYKSHVAMTKNRFITYTDVIFPFGKIWRLNIRKLSHICMEWEERSLGGCKKLECKIICQQ